MLGYQIIEFMLFVLLHRCMLCPIESFVMRFVVFYCVFVCLMCSSSLNSVDGQWVPMPPSDQLVNSNLQVCYHKFSWINDFLV